MRHEIGVNREDFQRIFTDLLNGLPHVSPDSGEPDILALLKPLERIALVARMAAGLHFPLAPESVDSLREKLVAIQKAYIDNDRLDFVDAGLRLRLGTTAGWLAQAICIMGIENRLNS